MVFEEEVLGCRGSCLPIISVRLLLKGIGSSKWPQRCVPIAASMHRHHRAQRNPMVAYIYGCIYSVGFPAALEVLRWKCAHRHYSFFSSACCVSFELMQYFHAHLAQKTYPSSKVKSRALKKTHGLKNSLTDDYTFFQIATKCLYQHKDCPNE